MAARKSKVKDTYWHNLAGFCILQGLKPAQVVKVLKEAFPLTEVTGRHVGAYKRRMISDGNYVPDTLIMSVNDTTAMANDLVTKEDRFVYDCTVGSQIQSLKCFQYKLTKKETNELEKAEAWIKNLKA